MREHLGEEYAGTVSAITSFGLFVTLDALYVEGLVHITELGGEYYRFDEVHQELRGERSGARYAVGTRVRVQVSRVDLDSRRIDFRLVRDGEVGHAGHARARRARARAQNAVEELLCGAGSRPCRQGRGAAQGRQEDGGLGRRTAAKPRAARATARRRRARGAERVGPAQRGWRAAAASRISSVSSPARSARLPAARAACRSAARPCSQAAASAPGEPTSASPCVAASCAHKPADPAGQHVAGAAGGQQARCRWG